jgi:hypothetical protein
VDLGFGGFPFVRTAICVDEHDGSGSWAKQPKSGPTHLIGSIDNLYWFKDGVLDYVFSSHHLCDIFDTEKTLKEWLRVLKPGGLLVLFLPDEQAYQSVTPLPIRNQAHKHAEFSLDYLKKCLRNIGYTDDCVIHELWPVPNNYYSFDMVIQKPITDVVVQDVKIAADTCVPDAVSSAPPAKSLSSLDYENKKLVQLGHYGDIINVLPIAKDICDKTGKPTTLVCKRDYADILDGVTYAVPEYAPRPDFSPGEVTGGHIIDACATQPTSARKIPHNLQAWEQAGYLDQWSNLTPVFDRRCRIRETALVERYVSFEKPVILVTLEADVSTMRSGIKNSIRKLIDESFGEHFQIVDAGQIKAKKPYDMLGLIDVASVVITVDTMLLHLCTATNVPVIALLSDHPPVFWNASATKGNILKAISYDKVTSIWSQIVRIIKSGHRVAQLPKERVVHVVPVYTTNDSEAQRRMQTAKETWSEFHSVGAEFKPYTLQDSSRVFTVNGKPIPFLKEVLKLGIEATAGNDDIVCFTHADTVLTPGLYFALQHRMKYSDSCCSFRMDYAKVEAGQVPCGVRGTVRDLFAFKRRWLLAHMDAMPDFLVGVGGWSDAMALWLRRLAGYVPENCDTLVGAPDIEMDYGYVWHEKHDADWSTNVGGNYDEALEHNRACINSLLVSVGLSGTHKSLV